LRNSRRICNVADMNLRRAIASRWFITLLLLAAWVGASNHCALGMMQGASAVRLHAGCCGHQTRLPAYPTKNAPAKECCAALRSTVPTPEKALAAPLFPDRSFQPAALWTPRYSILPKTNEVEPIETGPPRDARSFAELILQRSLRSHAPPLAS
jgi:hypothetical protein